MRLSETNPYEYRGAQTWPKSNSLLATSCPRRESGAIPSIMAIETILDDQKKRALEALERRFAVAKAELLQQQQHQSKKRFREEEEKVNQCTNSGSSTHTTDSSIKSTLHASSKKGNLCMLVNCVLGLCLLVSVENHRIFLEYPLVYSLPFFYIIFLLFVLYLFFLFLCLPNLYK